MSDHDNHEDHEDHGEEQNPGLVKKNRQLLSEAKQSRARADELQAQLDAANSELTAIKLTNPVNDMLSDWCIRHLVSLPDWLPWASSSTLPCAMMDRSASSKGRFRGWRGIQRHRAARIPEQSVRRASRLPTARS